MYCGFDRNAVDLRTLKSEKRIPIPALGSKPAAQMKTAFPSLLHQIERYLGPGSPVARIHKVDRYAYDVHESGY